MLLGGQGPKVTPWGGWTAWFLAQRESTKEGAVRETEQNTIFSLVHGTGTFYFFLVQSQDLLVKNTGCKQNFEKIKSQFKNHTTTDS